MIDENQAAESQILSDSEDEDELGEDEQHGLSDLSLSDQLYHFMVGGTRR